MTEQIKCKFIDPVSHATCEVWYDYDPDQKFCAAHRSTVNTLEIVPHIPRTVRVMPENEVNDLNAAKARCLQMPLDKLVEHIRYIEDRIKELEREKRAAMMAKRDLEDQLTDEERAALRKQSNGFVVDSPVNIKKSTRKSGEEKAKSRKEGFPAWAARLNLKVEDLYVMDDDELNAKIAKYKASKGGCA